MRLGKSARLPFNRNPGSVATSSKGSPTPAEHAPVVRVEPAAELVEVQLLLEEKQVILDSGAVSIDIEGPK